MSHLSQLFKCALSNIISNFTHFAYFIFVAKHNRGHLGAGGALPYLGYTGTCRWTGYGFLALLS